MFQQVPFFLTEWDVLSVCHSAAATGFSPVSELEHAPPFQHHVTERKARGDNLWRLRPLTKRAFGGNEWLQSQRWLNATSTKTNKLVFPLRNSLPPLGAMLDPSSSEDTGGESDPEVVREGPHKPASSSAGKQRAKDDGTTGEEEREKEEEEERRKERERAQEEQQRKIKLQIYLLVLRCIAYPFNAKQPTDMARRQQKVSCTCCWSWRERNLLHKLLRLERNLLLDAIRPTHS